MGHYFLDIQYNPAQMAGDNGFNGGKVIYIDTENTFRDNHNSIKAKLFPLITIILIDQ